MNTLGQSEYDIQGYAQRERVRKCAGVVCLIQANRYCDQQVPWVTKALFSEFHLVA